MASEKPNFLSQPVVKNVFMFRNGDPYYEARRIVINQKRVSNFETLLREVTGGIQAPFGAVRNIYTPRGGHKVDSMEGLQSGEQYVAAGRERFKKLDYLQIGSRKRRMLQTLPLQAKPVPQSRIIVSARFLKPIKEPCTIFVVANGDVLNPAVRLLIHQRMLGQFDKILELITERMGLKVLGGVRSLYTYEGQQVTDGIQLESGQLYVAVGREKFKKLPYSDLLFPKPRGTRRVNGVKANPLPPIYRFSKQNGNSKSTTRRSDSGGTDPKTSPQGHNGKKEHLSSIVREISQARLISLRKKRSGQSMTLAASDHDDQESKANDGNTDDKPPEDQPDEEKPAEEDTKAAEEKDEKAGEEEKPASENLSPDSKADEETNQETTVEDGKEEKENEATEDKGDEGPDNGKEGKVEEKEGDQKANDDEEGQGAVGDEKKEGEEEEEEIEEEVKEDADEKKEEVKSEGQGPARSTPDKSQDREEKGDGSHTSSVGEEEEEEEEVGKNTERRDKDSEDQNNDVDKDKEGNKPENGDDPERTQSDGETKGSDKSRSNSSNSNQEEGRHTKEGAAKESEEEERKENGDGDEQESEAEPEAGEKNSAGLKDTTTSGEKEEVGGKN